MSLARAVSRAMERIAPLSLAETWDNVGLILEAPGQRREAKNVLLTIDLSPRVFQEALSLQNTAVIVSYHPPIFKPLKSLTLSNPLQSSLLGCAASGISVYSPHTALDCVHGGINDWLAYGVLGCDAAEARLRLRDSNPAINVLGETKGAGAGLGRIVKINEANLSIGALAARLKKFLNLEHVQVAPALGGTFESSVGSVAICAGSGGSVLGGVPADVHLTGEMQHHDVLAAVALGTHVILCGHTNTERGYLPILADELRKELNVEDAEVNVTVSQVDAHPLYTV